MAYGRIHDEAASNGKLLALSDAAWRMWGNGLIYCQVNLTDGSIPSHAIHTFGVRARNKAKVAAELCAPQIPGKAPLWVAVDGGFQIHDSTQRPLPTGHRMGFEHRRKRLGRELGALVRIEDLRRPVAGERVLEGLDTDHQEEAS